MEPATSAPAVSAPFASAPLVSAAVVNAQAVPEPVYWEPDRSVAPPPWPVPPMPTAIARGLMGRCPACGKTHLFNGYLRVAAECEQCGAPLGLARADDAPPYFTILLVGHIVIPLMVLAQRLQNPSTLTMSAIFLPLSLFLTLALLRPVKGGTVGLMLKLDLLRDLPER